MTDGAWEDGMAILLAVGLPGWPEGEKEARARSAMTRELLDDLTDAQWLYAANTAAGREKWFPVPGTLREYAEDYVPPYPLLPPARDEETREADREVARRGIELIRQALKERTGVDPGEAVKDMG